MTVLLPRIFGYLKLPLAMLLTVAVLTGCEADSVLPTNPEGAGGERLPGISPAVSDGASGGSESVWFLPPFFSDPSGNPAFDAGDSDPNLDVDIQIQCVSDPGTGFCDSFDPTGTVVLADADLMEDVEGGFYFYQYDWKSPRTDVGTVFRALAKVGGSILGFFDLEVVKGNGQPAAGNVALRQGATAPIKVMIEEAFGSLACEVDNDVCVSVVPNNPVEDVLIELEVTDGGTDPDFTVLIPAGTTFTDENGDPVDGAVFTLETCEDAPVDLQLVGDCYSSNTEPPNLTLSLDATVSICGINDVLPPFNSEDQEKRATVHQFDRSAPGSDIVTFLDALPHAPENCGGGGAALPSSFWGRLAHSVKGRLLGWLGPEPLVASNVVLDEGGGGRTGGFRSDFQAAVPSKTVADVADADALQGSTVVPNPTVRVVDSGNDSEELDPEPVMDAFVRFEVSGGNGSLACVVAGPDCEELVAGSSYRVRTNMDGEASIEWTVPDNIGDFTMHAFSKAMVDADEAVLMPDGWPGGGQTSTRVDCNNLISGTLPPGCSDDVFEGAVTGQVTFTATAFETVVEQDGNVFGLQPLAEAQSVASFYSYDDEEAGGDNASANTGLSGDPLEVSNTSRLLLFQEAEGPLSLVILHDAPNEPPGSGGSATFVFSGSGLGSAGFTVTDGEGGDIFNFPGTTYWQWLSCCTDGGAIGPLPAGFELTISPSFGVFDGGQILNWELVTFPDGDRSSKATQGLDLTLPVTIKQAGGGS